MPGGGRAARTPTGSMPLTSGRARGSPVTALSVTPAITGSASPLLLILLTKLRDVGALSSSPSGFWAARGCSWDWVCLDCISGSESFPLLDFLACLEVLNLLLETV